MLTTFCNFSTSARSTGSFTDVSAFVGGEDDPDEGPEIAQDWARRSASSLVWLSNADVLSRAALLGAKGKSAVEVIGGGLKSISN